MIEKPKAINAVAKALANMCKNKPQKDENGKFVCGAYDNMVYNNRLTFSWELCEPIYKHFNVPKNPSEDA